ncbi:hypothetical protein [Paraflavitalea speifideaquila]|uniref:hypothetical protein n=1 Tax=Paraflavitalea speifideaquila TaxID=3076558 RepID=UPI0028EC66E5|nr:hypothetical protein [Paraflavitalea speifideiaquila]
MMPDTWGQGERLDVSTYRLSKAYLEAQHPRLFYIDFGDLDCFAHDGAYNKYLDAAYKTDLMIRDLWEYLQKIHFIKTRPPSSFVPIMAGEKIANGPVMAPAPHTLTKPTYW